MQALNTKRNEKLPQQLTVKFIFFIIKMELTGVQGILQLLHQYIIN